MAENHGLIFSILFSLFWFLFSLPTANKAIPLSNALYANFQGNSFEHDVNFSWMSECFPSSSNESSANLTLIWEISDGLRKSPGILPFMVFIESTSEWASTHFNPFDVFCGKRNNGLRDALSSLPNSLIWKRWRISRKDTSNPLE